MFAPDGDKRPVRSVRKGLVRRFPWLSANHPVVAREIKYRHYDFPPFIRKLADPWSMLGYSLLLHGFLFIFTISALEKIAPSLTSLFLPFVTPFGTVFTFAMLHSVLYWVMLIGISHFMVKSVGKDIESGAWQELRLTQLSGGEILMAKVVAAFRQWLPILRILVLTRMLGLLLIPVANLSQRVDDRPSTIALNVLGAGLFIAQPVVDAFLVSGLSALSGAWIRGTIWAKIGAYAASALAFGLLNSLTTIWLMFKTPMGPLAGLLVPMGQWTTLVSGIVPATDAVEVSQRMALLAVAYFVLPILIGIAALGLAFRRTQRAR